MIISNPMIDHENQAYSAFGEPYFTRGFHYVILSACGILEEQHARYGGGTSRPANERDETSLLVFSRLVRAVRSWTREGGIE